MNLSKKKVLAAKALNVGKNRLIFSSSALSEIKEAITKQDIKSLHSEGIIKIKPVKGRKKVTRRKTRRGPGKIKKKVNNRKQVYVKITRKLRAYIMGLRDRGTIERDLYKDLRKKIRMRFFKSKAGLRDYLIGVGIDLKKNVVKSDNKVVKKKVKKEDSKKKTVKKEKKDETKEMKKEDVKDKPKEDKK